MDSQVSITVSQLLVACLLGFPVILLAFYQLLKWTVSEKLGTIQNSLESLREDIKSLNNDFKSQGRQIGEIDNRLARLEEHNRFAGPLNNLLATIEKRKSAQ